MTRRLLPAAALLAASVVLALLARPHSRGVQVRQAGSSYLQALAEDSLQPAHAMLSDSLQRSISPRLLGEIAPETPLPAARLTGREGSLYLVGFRTSGGTTRTLRVAVDGEGPVIHGDSRLEGLMGRAGDMCVSYARGTVAPAVLQGASPEEFSCPVTGAPYGLSSHGGRLVCPAGHLGDGVVLSTDACSARRDSLAVLAGSYLAAHDSLPAGFGAMYQGLDLSPWERVGYTCPADATVHYLLRSDSTVCCPFHDQATPIPGAP